MAKKDDLLIIDDSGSGRKEHQRMKPFLVYMYLLKKTDENHAENGKDIAEYLKEHCGIYAERRSIYKDVKELNIASLMLEDNCTFEEAEEMLADDEELALVKYKPKKGFYIDDCRRPITFEDARILADCVYHARFIPKKNAESLIDVICGSLSETQGGSIQRDVTLVDRMATNNREILLNAEQINQAIKAYKKIKFKYLQYNIKDVTQQVERKGGGHYTVSPYALMINEGNYYLLGMEEGKKEVRTYRVDRMSQVSILDVTIEKTEEYKRLMRDIKSYPQRVFSMYGGRRENVTIRFINPLLDTVVDRFGTKEVRYEKDGEKHFTVSTSVEVSDQFFGWLCGFGKRAKIVYPDSLIKEFKEHLEKIQSNY